MKLEDVDFPIETETGTFNLSEMTDQDMRQIDKIAEAIILNKIFKCETKATIAAFTLYIESIIQTNEWISEGNKHH